MRSTHLSMPVTSPSAPCSQMRPGLRKSGDGIRMPLMPWPSALPPSRSSGRSGRSGSGAFLRSPRFTRLRANYAYLVKVASDAGPFSLSLKGKAAMPRVSWRNDGLNLVGFPTSEAAPLPTIGSYLAPASLLGANTEIFRYIGGPISADNPAKLLNPVQQALPRGEAFWMDTGSFSDYYGPLKVQVSLSSSGLSFGDTGSVQRGRCRQPDRPRKSRSPSLQPPPRVTAEDHSPVPFPSWSGCSTRIPSPTAIPPLTARGISPSRPDRPCRSSWPLNRAGLVGAAGY